MSEHKAALEYRQDSIGDRIVLHQVFEERCYDLDRPPVHPQVAWLRKWLEGVRDPLIIDAGANIGASAVYFATAFPAATVVAIEPEPGNYALLEKNTRQRPTIRPLHGALSCSNDTLFVHDPGRGHWGFTVSSEISAQSVQAYGMHNLLLRMFPGVPFIAKVDIEGAEAQVFRRDADWIAQFPLLIVEIHDWMLPGQGTSRNLLRALAAYNFDVVLRGENLWCFNLDLLHE